MSDGPRPTWAAVGADPLGPVAATRRGTWVFVLFVLGIALYDLGWRSLHNLDLARFGVLAREMIRTGEWLVPTRYGEIYANKPPLYIWAIALPASLLGGVTPLLVRLPCAVGLVLMVLSTAWWGRLRGASVGVARAAALLLLGTYLLTRLGRESRPDMLAAGLAALGTVLLDALALGRGRAGWALVTGAVLGLAVLTKGPAVLMVPVFVLLLPAPGRGTWARLGSARLPLVGLAFLAVVLAWLVPAWLQAGPSYVRELLVDQAVTRVAGEGNKLEPWYHYAVRLVDGGAPWTPLYLLALALLVWPKGRRLLGAWQGPVLAALLVLVVFTLVPTKHVRYVVGVFPLLALGGAAAVGEVLGGRRPEPWWPDVLRHGGRLVFVLGLAALVLGSVVPSSRVAALVPAGLLLALAALALRWRPSDVLANEDADAVARRRVAGLALLTVALLLCAYWVFRDRYRVREADAFNQEVAAVASPDVPFLTLAELTPEEVFDGAPHARAVRGVEALPTAAEQPRLHVLLPASARPAVEARRGERGEVLVEAVLKDGQRVVVLLAFGGADRG